MISKGEGISFTFVGVRHDWGARFGSTEVILSSALPASTERVPGATRPLPL